LQLQADDDPVCPRVVRDVRKRLLGDAIEVQLLLVVQQPRRRDGGELEGQAVALGELQHVRP